MGKFLKNTLIFSIIVLFIHLIFALSANAYIDDYYGKLSNGHKNSLVIGTSRALQGIIPTTVDSTLQLKERKLYNFAFTLSSSPFGKVYFDAITKKISQESTDNYCIIAIDPWSLSEKMSFKSTATFDSLSALYELNDVCSNPNFEYLYSKYPNGWGNLVLKRLETYLLLKNARKLNKSVSGSFSYVNNDGHLKVYTSLDDKFVAKKEINKLKVYREIADSSLISAYRLDYLLKTINLLKKQGKVYLVRLPVPNKMLQLEEKYAPNFNTLITEATARSDGYFDITNFNNNYKFTDGNHLEKSSSKLVSIEIGKWIKFTNN